MLAEAQGKLAIECPTGDGTRCKGVQATIVVYQSAVKGNLATLKDLGPAIAVDGTAEKVAEVVSLMGGDGGRALKLVETFRPFMWSLFLELTSIVCFGFALSHTRQEKPAQTEQAAPNPAGKKVVPAAPVFQGNVVPLKRAPETPMKHSPETPRRETLKHQPIEEVARLRSEIAEALKYGPVSGSQRALAGRFKSSVSSLNRALKQMSREVGVFRVSVGQDGTRIEAETLKVKR